MLLQYLPSSAVHDQSWALSEGWMDLGTVRLPAHRWDLACTLLNHLPAAALPVGCLHRLDVLQSNKDLFEEGVLAGTSGACLEACLQQLSVEGHQPDVCWGSHVQCVYHAQQQADITGCCKIQIFHLDHVTLPARPQGLILSTSPLPWHSRVLFMLR